LWNKESAFGRSDDAASEEARLRYLGAREPPNGPSPSGPHFDHAPGHKLGKQVSGLVLLVEGPAGEHVVFRHPIAVDAAGTHSLYSMQHFDLIFVKPSYRCCDRDDSGGSHSVLQPVDRFRRDCSGNERRPQTSQALSSKVDPCYRHHVGDYVWARLREFELFLHLLAPRLNLLDDRCSDLIRCGKRVVARV
jgi:hypothetical protein